MKRLIICIVCLSLLFSLAACQNSDPSDENTVTEDTGETPPAEETDGPEDTGTLPVTFPDTLSLDTLYPIQNSGKVTLISSDAGGMEGETAENLFDSDLSTKFCTENTDYTIVWKLDRAYGIGGYSIQTANDTARFGRIPESWTLEGSVDGSEWVTVSTISDSGIRKRDFTEYFYELSVPAAYAYFRFTLQAPSDITQMSEITLYTSEKPQILVGSADVDLSDNIYGSAGLELLKTIIDDYYNRTSHTLRGEPRGGASAVWGVASFVEALAEGYRLNPGDDTILRTYLDVLNYGLTAYKVNGSIRTPTGTWEVSYYNATRGSAGDYYYDDDAWICLQYLNAYTLLGDASYLERAKEMLDFFWTGWDTKLDGGIYWDKSFGSKNTCANGPIAIAFLSAYEMTGEAEYLTKGQQIYDWVRSKLMDNSLYSDNISLNGSVNGWKAAYNQGTMLCAGSLLYRITGERRYLTQTRATYNATVGLMFRVSRDRVSMNGNPIYKAWCIGWLTRGFMLFEEVDPDQTTQGMEYLKKVLEKELTTKNDSGYYDPYFSTGDWGGESTTDVLQPSGIASVLLLAGMV